MRGTKTAGVGVLPAAVLAGGVPLTAAGEAVAAPAPGVAARTAARQAAPRDAGWQ